METASLPEVPRHYTFEDVWAALMKTQERQEENARQMELARQEADRRAQEYDRRTQERAQEWERRTQEYDRRAQERAQEWEKTERYMKRLGKQMGDLHHKFGKLAYHLVAPSIAKRFNELGYHFDIVWTKGCTIYDERGKIKAEIDILLENGDCIIGIEVKATVRLNDIEHHARRLEILRESRSKLHEERVIRGAIAGAIFEDTEKKATLEAGMYVLEQSGDTMKLEVPEGFVPREW